MKVIAISDSHGQEHKIIIPKCDLLIHAGDCDINTLEDLEKLNMWFGKQPVKLKIFVAGNHDFYLEKLHPNMTQEILTNAIYLQDSFIKINQFKIYGTPWCPRFNDWAFMRDSNFLKEKWKLIPDDTNILITHAPPFGILDQKRKANGDLGESLGCPFLRNRVKEINPKIYIFGHIHEAYGKYTDYKTDYYNVSVLDEYYELTNKYSIIL